MGIAGPVLFRGAVDVLEDVGTAVQMDREGYWGRRCWAFNGAGYSHMGEVDVLVEIWSSSPGSCERSGRVSALRFRYIVAAILACSRMPNCTCRCTGSSMVWLAVNHQE